MVHSKTLREMNHYLNGIINNFLSCDEIGRLGLNITKLVAILGKAQKQSSIRLHSEEVLFTKAGFLMRTW